MTLIPYYIGNLVFLALLLIPGNPASNRYGPPPPPNTKAVIVVASLWIPFMAWGIYMTALNG
ncbi:hypothetical protein D3C77_763930 [compost metagenome]